ncbi:hypothetical protein [Saccharothrix sp. ALI-22-I]|uniref:hypothetical protein n=1 Tax=Saccharothrix sp. ALI-22-I TaxID=1933778 RepID=UPI00117AB933|nr:hypothetical protein [Saccharothrix sp. ALI-22-I]
METEQLGKRVGEHRTDNGRRRRAAVAFLAVAAIGLGAGVPLSIVFFTDPTATAQSGALPGGLVALGLVCLCFGCSLWTKAVRTKGAFFEVYEHGIVHHVGGAVSVIRWSDIVSVRPYGVEKTGGPHVLGIDFYCVLRLNDRRRLKFNTYTADAPKLAATIDAAVNRGTPPG